MKKKLLEDIQDTLSALDRAEKLQIKAASVGFDWQNSNEIIKKIEEELNEVRDVIASNRIHDNLSEEIGDLIFSCINLARYYQINSETILQNTNNNVALNDSKLEIKITTDEEKKTWKALS